MTSLQTGSLNGWRGHCPQCHHDSSPSFTPPNDIRWNKKHACQHASSTSASRQSSAMSHGVKRDCTDAPNAATSVSLQQSARKHQRSSTDCLRTFRMSSEWHLRKNCSLWTSCWQRNKGIAKQMIWITAPSTCQHGSPPHQQTSMMACALCLQKQRAIRNTELYYMSHSLTIPHYLCDKFASTNYKLE